MSANYSSETNHIMSAHENNFDNESETRILTQDKMEEQMGNYMAPLTRQLEDLNRLIKGMFTVQRQNVSLKASTSASFRAAGSLPDAC